MLDFFHRCVIAALFWLLQHNDYYYYQSLTPNPSPKERGIKARKVLYLCGQ